MKLDLLGKLWVFAHKILDIQMEKWESLANFEVLTRNFLPICMT